MTAPVDPMSGLKSTTGSGRSVATIDPMLGMKLSRKAKSPNTRARSTPMTARTIPTAAPVTPEMIALVTM